MADGFFSQQLGAVIRVAPNSFEGLEWGKNGGENGMGMKDDFFQRVKLRVF